jgi:oxepin-CoA hydrolase/3-oxo-5,6-dehydrosuberyl-CoA semialdehyde dehydrogenase
MRQVRSYLEGRWVHGEEPASPLHDAVTGAVVATASSRGLDLGAALRYAREVGGPALRAMSFSERGALVGRLSAVIHHHRDELIELALINSGNTRGDAKFDIDGASGTLAVYAKIGESLGTRTFLLDGPQEQFSRSKRFLAQHVLVPRQGAAVHINAFNFPAWGLAEKAAVALIAGVPVFAKPATATAMVTARIVELWAEHADLPPGVVSLLCGSAGDLLDHLGPQDVVAFTGSGDTGRMIKGHPRVLEHNVPVNVEADSLNAAVLGPEVAPGSDTFEMFLRDVVTDMTQKAGQKCTATRRILVARDQVEAVVEALTDRLDQQVVGVPGERATTVGPLATAAQQRDILSALDQLEQVAPRVWGDPRRVPAGGYYVAPALYRTDSGVDAPFVHDHEVFGPVATVVPYDGSAAHAVAIVARGGGGLVCSLYADDVDFAGPVVLGLAPWHGRLYWGSSKVHDQGSGPGTVMPGLVHGGPGKAGGGEELGGQRGLRFYQQRCVVQGDTALLARVLGN